VPVLQLSINAELPFEYHFNLGVKLHELRSQGVLILGAATSCTTFDSSTGANPPGY